MALNFVLKYGLQSLIDVKNCRFEIEISTRDLPVFDVQCEINAFMTGFIPVGIKINFNDPLQSIWNAAKSTIEMILGALGNIISGRKRREVRDTTLNGMYIVMRGARETNKDDLDFDIISNDTFKSILNKHLNNTSDNVDEYTLRKQIYAEKCKLFTRILSFLFDTTETLSQMVNETASTIRNLSSLQETMQTINLQTLSDNLTLETIGVNPEVALKDFNISSSTLDEAIENAKGNVSTDPLLENIASFADEASTFLAEQAESANKLFFVNQWIAAMNNVTLEYFDNDTCVSFLDCAHYAIAALYEQFMAVNITNQTESIDSISKFEDTFLLLVGNCSHTTEDVDSMAITLLATLRQMKELCVFCSIAPEMLGPLQNFTVNTGQQLSLVCNVTGDPTTTFWWYKDTHIISDQHSMTLTISKANIDDGGSYHCVAGNLVANYSFDEAFVTVLEDVFDDTEGSPSEYTTVNANEETEDSTKRCQSF
ncbi:uncharacterized protein LOC127842392 [Dreissena polymorpha]|uniref:uncharacterized protein LOC127842392 n=1 Tax=Dreissena polymorpha TaxID=45954 RepID=UPI002264D5A4|nr:uncharacterized protein LOC127842392 [Dreissena polymorpha]